MNRDFDTLSQAINGLKSQGYTLDFNLEDECLVCHKPNTVLSPDEFEIDAVFRFEGESNPDDESILFAISSPKYKVKGILVNAFGIYADEASNELVKKLQRHK